MDFFLKDIKTMFQRITKAFLLSDVYRYLGCYQSELKISQQRHFNKLTSAGF